MYTVKVWNQGDTEKYIWDYRKSDNLMKSSSIDKELEAVDQFSFDLIDCDIKLKSFISFVEVKNEVKNNVVFRGRIMTPSSQMNEDGTYNISYTSEGAMAYLDDFNPSYDMKTDLTPQQRLTHLINLHNSLLGADTYKRINIGTISVTPKMPESETAEYDDTAHFILDPEKSILTHIRELILGVYGGEILLRYESDGNYLDWVDKIGSKKSTEIKVGKNMKSFQRQIDPSEVITRLIPLGSSEPTAWEGSKRLEIVEDPRSGGKNYIDIPELIALYGIQTGVAVFDDEYTPDTLYDRGIKEKNEIMKKYAKMTTEIQLLDLFTIGLDPDDFERGNFYHTILPRYNIDEDLRVIGTSFDVMMPQNKSCRIGDKDLGILDVSDINTLNIIHDSVPSIIKEEAPAIIDKAVPGMIDAKITDFETETLPQTIEQKIDDNKDEIKKSVIDGINSSTDVIKSQAIVVDYGMIDKLMTNDLLTNRLVADDAYIRNLVASSIVTDKIKTTDIDLNRATIRGSTDTDNYIVMTNDYIRQYGKYLTYEEEGIQNEVQGYTELKNGMLRIRNDTRNRSIYLHQNGLTTNPNNPFTANSTLQFNATYPNETATGPALTSYSGPINIQAYTGMLNLESYKDLYISSQNGYIVATSKGIQSEFFIGKLMTDTTNAFALTKNAFLVTDMLGWNDGAPTYMDIVCRSLKQTSHERYKEDITEWTSDILEVYRNDLQLFRYKYKPTNEFDEIGGFYNHGIVIRENSNEDRFPSEWRNGDAYNQNEVTFWNSKAIQELIKIVDEIRGQINGPATYTNTTT
ncbi:phage tail spike protein [Macrococcus equi]|uniref:phage tail spike protein n=1 Tax=Macrococcus equi TaxID=3395462 RepID=UPI0039BE30E5